MERNEQANVSNDAVQIANNAAELNNLPELPRENLISTAVKFLQNPKVISSSISQKRAFLKSKGLSENEINIAVERSGVPSAPSGEYLQPVSTSPHPAHYMPPSAAAVVTPTSTWSKARDAMSTAMLLAGALYGIYYLYKKYLSAYLFGNKKSKLDTLEESVGELKRQVETTLQCVREIQQQQQAPWSGRPSTNEEVARMAERQYVEEIKGEIKSLKGLLLAPRQFPQPPSSRPVLPDWQRQLGTETKSVDPSNRSMSSSSLASSSFVLAEQTIDVVPASKSSETTFSSSELGGRESEMVDDEHAANGEHSHMPEGASVANEHEGPTSSLDDS